MTIVRSGPAAPLRFARPFALRGGARGAKAAAAFSLLALVGTIAAGLAPVAAAGEQPLVVLPCASSGDGARVLFGRRVLVQTGGGADVQSPFVPAWAGQWTPITGSVAVTSTSVITLAARLFTAQTGQPLPGASSARVLSDQSDDAASKVVVVPMSDQQLEQLATATQESITAGSPRQGWLAEVQVVTTAEALQRMGPVPPPEGGWAAYVVQRVYGGMQPGALDTTFPVLVGVLSARSQQPPTMFQEALLGVGAVCGAAAAPS